jgi:hypothetical protein
MWATEKEEGSGAGSKSVKKQTYPERPKVPDPERIWIRNTARKTTKTIKIITKIAMQDER